MVRKETVVAGAMLTIIAYTISLSFVGQVLSQNQTTTTVPNIGTVQGIGVGIYWDYECTNSVSTIDWGVLEPGASKNVVCYVRNDGDVSLTLSMFTDNWTPAEAASHISLSWDQSGQTLNPDQKRLVELTLSVFESVEGITNFSFDIIVVGSG